jgi:hypothetical protein
MPNERGVDGYSSRATKVWGGTHEEKIFRNCDAADGL